MNRQSETTTYFEHPIPTFLFIIQLLWGSDYVHL